LKSFLKTIVTAGTADAIASFLLHVHCINSIRCKLRRTGAPTEKSHIFWSRKRVIICSKFLYLDLLNELLFVQEQDLDVEGLGGGQAVHPSHGKVGSTNGSYAPELPVSELLHPDLTFGFLSAVPI
jgi:hypothetical protein